MITPTLDLNFLSGSVDPRVAVARANATATRINSTGYIETVAADTARLDYNPVSNEAKGLLVEESRANLLTQSSDFSVNWSRTNITVDKTAILAPDNTLTGNLLATATGSGQVTRNVNATATAHTFSLFIKKGPNNPLTSSFLIRNATTLTNLAQVVVTWSTMSFSSTIGGALNKWEQYKDGWWRVTLSASAGITVGNLLVLYAMGSTAVGYDMYAWGCQFEEGAFATSYIPTTTTALTRNADVAAMTGTNFSDFWQASSGGVLVRARPGTVSGTRPWVQFDDNTADNIIALRGNTTNPELYIKATTDQAAIDAGTIAANTSYRLAGTWATNDCAANLNGAAPVLDTSATIPAVTQMRLGSDGTNYLNGHIEAVEYYDQRLLNSALQVASSSAGYRSIIQPLINPVL
jgi:hypothetical protein